MDQSEFTRRICAYLRMDLPDLEQREEIAAALGRRLWRSVERPSSLPNDAPLLRSLFGDRAVALVFTARWDANGRGYAGVVAKHAATVVEVDVDGRIGAALAGVIGVMNTPTVAILDNGEVRGRFVGRRRDDAELREFLAEVATT
jgi:hypothetical protein